MISEVERRWQGIYSQRAPEQVSWYERVPATSLALIEDTSLPFDAAIIDVGGGTSTLAGELIARGYTDVTVTDISVAALKRAREGAGEAAAAITWIVGDIRTHDFGRRYDLWHDRAVFHFMVEQNDRERYVAVLHRTVRGGGHVVIATFGPDGPSECSGLPVQRYGPQELSGALGADFELVSSHLELHHTPSGASQQFLYAHLRRAPTGAR